MVFDDLTGERTRAEVDQCIAPALRAAIVGQPAPGESTSPRQAGTSAGRRAGNCIDTAAAASSSTPAEPKATQWVPKCS